MAAQIRFDQVGLTAGVAGFSRSDGLRTGARVTIVNGSGNPCRVEWWWKPPEDAAVLTQSLQTTWYFDPTAGVVGDYVVRMIEDEGLATETEDIKSFGIRYQHSGLLLPGLNTQGVETIYLSATTPEKDTAAARSAHNEVLPWGVGIRFASWWRFFRELFDKVEQLCRPIPTPAFVNPLVFDEDKWNFVESGGAGTLTFQLAGSGHSATKTEVTIRVYIAPNSGYTALACDTPFQQDGNPFTAFNPTKGFHGYFTRATNGSRTTFAVTGKVVLT